ncbi:hypothetical protein CC2G_002615 [Coprinopsis cinerea AmutBmut pab1-1]|nr:hypothetical protein CC2G_002615 [Coprinopsis cinerea AmutBmut pab1-1]
MPVIIDDTRISYSDGWQISGTHERQEQGRTHFTTTSGATATITFSGTFIEAFGTNPASHAGGRIEALFILDGETPFRLERTSHASAYYRDSWFKRENLPNREHTLVIQNVGTRVPLHLDFFQIEGSLVTPAPSNPPPPNTPSPPPAEPTTSPTPTFFRSVPSSSIAEPPQSERETPTPATNLLQSSSILPDLDELLTTTTRAVTDSSRERGSSSGRSESTGRPTADLQTTVTELQVVTTSISGQPVEITLDGTKPSGGISSGLPIGVVVGISLGAVALLILLAIFLVLLYRCRQRRKRRLGGHRGTYAYGGSSDAPGLFPYEVSGGGPLASESKTALVRSASDSGRPFQLLDDTANDIGTPTTAAGNTSSLAPNPPSLTLDFANEKSQPLSDSMSPYTATTPHDGGRSPSSTLANPSRFSSGLSSYHNFEAPPAYTSGRDSDLFPEGHISVARA